MEAGLDPESGPPRGRGHGGPRRGVTGARSSSRGASRAPRTLVFRAWTEPDRLACWFGPKGFTMLSCTLDLRPGGVFHYGMRSPDGHAMWGRWVFREVVAPERLVFVASFSDEAGGVTRHPFAPDWPQEVLSTVTFAEQRTARRCSTMRVPVNATASERAGLRRRARRDAEGLGGDPGPARRLPGAGLSRARPIEGRVPFGSPAGLGTDIVPPADSFAGGSCRGRLPIGSRPIEFRPPRARTMMRRPRTIGIAVAVIFGAVQGATRADDGVPVDLTGYRPDCGVAVVHREGRLSVAWPIAAGEAGRLVIDLRLDRPRIESLGIGKDLAGEAVAIVEGVDPATFMTVGTRVGPAVAPPYEVLAQRFEIDLRPVGLGIGLEHAHDFLNGTEGVLPGQRRHAGLHRLTVHASHHLLVLLHHSAHLLIRRLGMIRRSPHAAVVHAHAAMIHAHTAVIHAHTAVIHAHAAVIHRPCRRWLAVGRGCRLDCGHERQRGDRSRRDEGERSCVSSHVKPLLVVDA